MLNLFFRRDRPSRGGGVMIAVKKSLSAEDVSISKNTECIFCKINLQEKKPMIIGSVYRPPGYSIDESQCVTNEIYQIVKKFPRAVYWFGGDFNLPDINWKAQSIQDNNYSKAINSSFLEMAQDLGHEQINDHPTRGPNVLDLLFTNRPGLIKHCSLLPGLGDHEIIKIVSLFKPIRKKPTKRCIHLWNKANEADILQDTKNFSDTF